MNFENDTFCSRGIFYRKGKERKGKGPLLIPVTGFKYKCGKSS